MLLVACICTNSTCVYDAKAFTINSSRWPGERKNRQVAIGDRVLIIIYVGALNVSFDVVCCF